MIAVACKFPEFIIRSTEILHFLTIIQQMNAQGRISP
jgi:hypothetical protein